MVSGGGGAPAVAIDPWEMFDPVEILSKLPKDFYEQLVSKHIPQVTFWKFE